MIVFNRDGPEALYLADAGAIVGVRGLRDDANATRLLLQGGHEVIVYESVATVRAKLGPYYSSMPGSPEAFVQAALSQKGKLYVYGAEVELEDPDPDAFDCSELVQWAGAQVGIEIPDGSQNQRKWCKDNCTLGYTPTVEHGLMFRGWLLFNDKHVAINLGDGTTIEAKGKKWGVGVFSAKGRFIEAYPIPGLY